METHNSLVVARISDLVLILPMRNGNASELSGICKEEEVLILPMRNKKQRDARVARLYNLKINDGYNMFL